MDSIKIICVLMVFVVCSSSNNIEESIFGGKHDNLRIVNGKEAALGQFPHQASIRKYSRHLCGGSIINSRWILSAASCVDGTNYLPTAISASLGSINRENFFGEIYYMSHIIHHPAYNSEGLQNDIALLRTMITIDFSQYIEPIALPFSKLLEDTTVTIAGWGSTSYSSKMEQPIFSDTLQFMNVETLTNEECKESFMGSPFAALITNTLVCTYNPNSGVTRLDRGDPLITSNNTLVGIVSWATENYPDVHTRVYPYVDFINEEVSKDYDN